jgi:hypothetical protein
MTLERDQAVEEQDARLALLQTELNNIQSSIRALDTTILQIKGWCVTASLAIGGFAVTRQGALLGKPQASPQPTGNPAASCL